MHSPSFTFKQLFTIFVFAFATLFALTFVSAWTGPTAAPPGNNVPAPINVGTIDQVKNGGLSVNAFAAFGTAYFAGKVGIGTASPSYPLTVVGGVYANQVTINNTGYGYYGLSLTDSQTPNRWVRLFTEQGAGGTGMELTQDGASDGTAWQVLEDTNKNFMVVHPGTATGLFLYPNGSVTISGTLAQNSDQRLKTNIQSLGASSSLAAIDQLNPVTFNWIDPEAATTTQFGFIAQDVKKIFPNLVSVGVSTTKTPGGTLSLDYDGLIAPMVKAIQEQQSQIQKQQSEIDALQQQNETLQQDNIMLQKEIEALQSNH